MAEKKETVETKPMNIYQKLQKSRVDLQNKKLKKTGKNDYSHYTYFELGDFLPSINEICANNGLATIFQFTNDLATLDVIDVDNIEKKIQFSTPVEIASLKGCSTIQNIGGTQSYCRRYLYMMAFEIAESDLLDAGNVDLEKEQQKEDEKLGNTYIGKTEVDVITKLIKETGADTKKFLSWVGADKVEHIKKKHMGVIMKKLKEKQEEQQANAAKENEFPPELQL